MDGNFCVDPLFSLNEKNTWGGAKLTRFVSPRKFYKDDDEEEISTNESINLLDGENKEDYYKRVQSFVKEDNSHVEMDWVLPYDIPIPIAQYVSENKGGILTVSTEIGCQAWKGTFKGEVLSKGSYEAMADQLTEDRKVIFEQNKLYFMSSNTPHETLKANKGKRRTFLRITLNHNYLNSNI